MNTQPLIIIGSGPAGLTAAIYAGRAGLKPTLFIGSVPGGQLTLTSIIENYPGFPDGILGTELMDRFRKQAEKFETTIINQAVNKVDLKQNPFLVESENKQYHSQSIIIATGASAKWLGIPSEEKFKGKGISACAICDGPLFQQKDVVVIGGGDAAMEEALYLSKYANKVIIIHRREQFRASSIMLERAEKNPKISLITSADVKEFLGFDRLEAVKIINKEGETEEIKVQGAFIAIGHTPNSSIFKEFLTTDQKNYIQSNNPPFTDIKGVFVAGDIYDCRYRQAITAAGSGCQAALEAEKYLEELINV